MQLDTASDEEEHLDEGLVRVETKGTSGNHPEQVVEAFHDPVRISLIDVGKDPLLMLADRTGSGDEWLKTRVRCPPEPLFEFTADLAGTDVSQDGRESFLEQVRPVEWTIRLLQVAQLMLLRDVQFPRALEQDEAQALDLGTLIG